MKSESKQLKFSIDAVPMNAGGIQNSLRVMGMLFEAVCFLGRGCPNGKFWMHLRTN